MSEKTPTMARHGLRTRPPGGDPRAADVDDEEDADGDGRRIPSVPIPHHTHILLARVHAPYSPPRLRNGSFAHASRSGGPRNLLELQALHPAQPPAPELAMARYGLRTQPPGGEPEAVDSDEAEAADGDGCGNARSIGDSVVQRCSIEPYWTPIFST